MRKLVLLLLLPVGTVASACRGEEVYVPPLPVASSTTFACFARPPSARPPSRLAPGDSWSVVIPGGGAIWLRPRGGRHRLGSPKGKVGCIPRCRGKICGTDGCGGSCGRCGRSKICLGGRCLKNTTLVLCRRVAGRWKGLMLANPLHHLDGRIFVRGSRCLGSFRVSYRLRSGQAWVQQEMQVFFSGDRMRMVGLRISRKSPNSSYNLDRFEGRLKKKLTYVKGINRDVRGSQSPFYLKKM